jgi:predicted  nucleic acid-binding Zn-ribbon protein
MTDTLPRLLVLQACDQRIQQMIHTLDTLQQSLAALKEEDQVKVQAVRAWQEKITESEKARNHLTLQIKQVKGQLRGKRGMLHRRRTGQQEETVQREIVLLEASKAALEEELRAVTAQIAQDMDALHQAEELAAAHHAHVLSMTSTVLGQRAAVEEELRAAQDKRTVLTTGINTFLLQEYERIFARRGGIAVVALANETCQGCHMHLPPQMCLELQRHPRLTFCPHCQRILSVPLETNLHVVEPQSAANGTDGYHPRQPRQHAKSRTRTAKESDGTVVPPADPAQV